MSVIPVLPEAHEFTRMETREVPPAHFLIKIESSLFEPSRTDKFETKEFVAGDYKWRLIIYPNGDNTVEEDSGYISVYLAMANTSSNWDVYAVFTIFLYNHISGKYLSSLGRTRRFRGTKSQWGFSKFISKETFADPSNGYVVDDNCVFGAEVFVVKRESLNQCFSLKDGDIPFRRDWKITNYSELGDEVWQSEEFDVGVKNWKIRLHPRGHDVGADSHVSIYLCRNGPERVQASYTLCIKNQISDQHKKVGRTCVYTPTNPGTGSSKFIEIETMNDPRKGFIVNNSCLVHIEITSVQVLAR